MQKLIQDIRFGIRMLGKASGSTAIAILTLALGVGANTALFSVVNGVLLNPLPYPHPSELVIVAEKDASVSESSISYPNFLDWVRDNRAFASLAAYRHHNVNLTGSGKAERVNVTQVSASFFPLLGVKLVMGRNFTGADDIRGAAPVVILSNTFWKSKFVSSPEILGKTITLDGTAYTVVGILPASFYFSSPNFQLGDVYVPIGWR